MGEMLSKAARGDEIPETETVKDVMCAECPPEQEEEQLRQLGELVAAIRRRVVEFELKRHGYYSL